MSSWYERSMDFINRIEDENPDMEREELKKLCSKEYPFGERKYWPYKAFLRAMRDRFNPQAKAQKERCPSTVDLFEVKS